MKPDIFSMKPDIFRFYYFDEKQDIEKLATDMRQLVMGHRISQFPLEKANRIAYGLALFMWRRRAEGAKLLVRKNQVGSLVGIDFIVLDKQKGYPTLEQLLRKEMKEILGLVDHIDVYSQPELGNAVLLRIWNDTPDDLIIHKYGQFGSLLLAKPGQELSGDLCATSWNGSSIQIMVSDGLGSGMQAREASNTAADSFLDHLHQPLYQQMAEINRDLKNTRGAAVALASISTDELKYCGIGNISGRIFRSELESKACLSYNGTVGFSMPDFQEIVYPCPGSGLFLMYSDGMAPVWSLSHYPGVISCDPTLIAAVLYRDFGKGMDDIAVITLKTATRSDQMMESYEN